MLAADEEQVDAGLTRNQNNAQGAAQRINHQPWVEWKDSRDLVSNMKRLRLSQDFGGVQSAEY